MNGNWLVKNGNLIYWPSHTQLLSRSSSCSPESFPGQLNRCFVPSRLVPLTLSISFYRPDLAKPANTINYQSVDWNAFSDTEPQLNQLKNTSPLGRKECVPAQTDEEALLVMTCLLSRRHATNYDHLNKSIRLLRPKMSWIKQNKFLQFVCRPLLMIFLTSMSQDHYNSVILIRRSSWLCIFHNVLHFNGNIGGKAFWSYWCPC